MDVRPGGPPLVEPILITRWIRLDEGVQQPDEELNMSGEPAKPWPQPVSNFTVEEPLPAVSPKAVGPQYS
jgi:hypothetical protein